MCREFGNASGSECYLLHLVCHLLSVAPHLNNTPDQAVFELCDVVVILAYVLDGDVTVGQVVKDLLLVLIIEGTGLVMINETRDTSGATIVGYVPDLVDVIEACSECIVKCSHVVNESKCT